MKTIKQLRDERAMSAVLYKGILRNVCFAMSSYGKSMYYDEVKNLTVKDVLDMFSESEILRWKGISTKSLEELKSLA